jgi:hypothetical protein
MALKRPDAISFSKKNAIRPFEDPASLEFWAQKNDASMFIVGQSTKKRPNGLIFARMFDYKLLDMCEVGVENFVSMQQFKVRLVILHAPSSSEILRFYRHRNAHPVINRCCTLPPNYLIHILDLYN